MVEKKQNKKKIKPKIKKEEHIVINEIQIILSLNYRLNMLKELRKKE